MCILGDADAVVYSVRYPEAFQDNRIATSNHIKPEAKPRQIFGTKKPGPARPPVRVVQQQFLDESVQTSDWCVLNLAPDHCGQRVHALRCDLDLVQSTSTSIVVIVPRCHLGNF